jgi:D-glycero-D-manno-heptose 1,7-bisphosphate phosphatase
MPHTISLDRRWTLFLDRDGVLNRRLPGRYVRTPDELQLLPGVEEALRELRPRVGWMAVITNQQGIGRGLMTEDDLRLVHLALTERLRVHGVHLDGIYPCPHRDDEGCGCRKPAPGLVEAACRDHPGIDLGRAVMIGDSDSDVALGHALDLVTVLVRDPDDEREPPRDPHLTVASLAELAGRASRDGGELSLDRPRRAKS